MASALSSRCLPVVVILGCTGTGKSKLAIEIGRRIGGEIISADSMQVYKGLDIITNKVTAEERAACTHHLLDFVPPLSEFSVVQFRDMALPLIQDIMERNKVPIIVGGTHYYIESLLWDVLVSSPEGSNGSSAEQNADETRAMLNERKSLEGHPSDTKQIFGGKTGCSEIGGVHDGLSAGVDKSLYDRLAEVDPVTAERLHPNDTRKIARSLQIYEQHGIPQSQILQAQREKEGGSIYGGPLRFGSTCVFWLQCKKEILNPRLDKRVDEMLKQGMLRELFDFHQEYNKTRVVSNDTRRYTEGIFQAIGFKELHEFLVKHEGKTLDETSLSTEHSDMLTSCVDSMKCATRRYAKKQVTWIKNRFLSRPSHAAPDVYGLDATDLTQWEDSVLKVALGILDKIVVGQEPSFKPLPRIDADQNSKLSRFVCGTCDDRVIIGGENWEKHLVSKKHKWNTKRVKREEAQELS